MSVENLSFRRDSPNLKKFVEQGWNKLASFQEFEAEIEAEQRSPPSNPSFSSFMSKSASMKKRKPVSIFNSSSPNNSAATNRSRSSYDSKEKFVIEDVSSDDEPTEKKIGLCTEKGNRIIVQLGRKKQRRSLGDLSKGATNSSRSTNGSYSLPPSTRSSIFGNRSLSSETTDKPSSVLKPSKSLKAIDQSRPSIETNKNRGPSQSITEATTPEPAKKRERPAGSNQATNAIAPNLPMDNSKSDSPILQFQKRTNLFVHSTPKVTAKPQNPANDCSPLSRFNNENHCVDFNDSPSRVKDSKMPNENEKLTKDERPKEIANRSKARTLFNSTNTKFNEEFHAPSSPVQLPLSQTISAPDSPILSNKTRRPNVNFGTIDSAKKRHNQMNPFKTPTKQQPKVCTSLVPYVERHGTPPKASQVISQCESPTRGARTGATESRCFLRLSKKMEKLLTNHQVAKMNENKLAEHQKQRLLYDLLESIHLRLEAQKLWLSANKTDDVERDSLFLKLTRVAEPRNGFVDCDCVIDVSRMKKVILFKYSRLKTMIPTHYANCFEISCGAVLEYVGPWCSFDCDQLEVSYVENPFWVNILEHGHPKLESNEYEVVWTNPDHNVDKNMLLALTE